MEWVLDQYKESTPKDPTIREKFNTYRFADYKEKVIEITKKNGEYLMTLHLPFAEKGKVDLWVKGDDLILRVDQVKRTIRLPRALSGRALKGAALKDGRFAITFEGGA